MEQSSWDLIWYAMLFGLPALLFFGMVIDTIRDRGVFPWDRFFNK